jgi:hypothetical protein
MSRRYRSREALREITVNGEKYTIDVDSEGQFSCRVDGDFLRTDRLADLLPQIRRIAQKRRVFVAVPAVITGIAREKPNPEKPWVHEYYPRACHRITLTSVNPKTNEINFIFEDGTKSSKERAGWRDDVKFCKPMTDEQMAEWKRLIDDRDRALKAFESFIKRFEMKDPHETMRKAIDAKFAEEPPDDSNVDPRDKPERKKKR